MVQGHTSLEDIMWFMQYSWKVGNSNMLWGLS